MNELSHPNIIKLYKVFETNSNYILFIRAYQYGTRISRRRGIIKESSLQS